MTAPRIVRTGVARFDVFALDIREDGRNVAVIIDATPEIGAARALHGQRVRVTIEPVEPEAPPPGDPLDYLAQARAIITDGTLDALCGPAAQPTIARLESLLNTVHLATVAARRRSTP